MYCNSKQLFSGLLAFILTFAFGLGIVEVQQDFTSTNLVEETKQEVSENIEFPEFIQQTKQTDPCEEIMNISYSEKLKSKWSSKKTGKIIALGVLNQRVCKPLPFRPIDVKKEKEGKDYILVKVLIDKEGFVRQAESDTKSDLRPVVIKLAYNLRMRPVNLGGQLFVGRGVLVFYPEENRTNQYTCYIKRS